MAIASLNEVIQSYIMRRNQIQSDLLNYSDQKMLSASKQSDLASWKSSKEQNLRVQYQKLFSTQYKPNFDTYSYADYSQIPEYQDEVDYVESYYDSQIADVSAWETELNSQTSTLNTELNEVNAYIDSFKQTISSNIKNDYDYGQAVSG